jgi:hypothetical protein
MLRSIEPEWLDSLEASDARALRARRDLRLVNFLMGNAGAVARAISGSLRGSLRDGARIADLGAGDGTFMLRVAKKMRPRPVGVELALVDRAGAIARETSAGFRCLQWQATAHAADAAEWLRGARTGVDLIVANLFLHHFEALALRELARLASERTRVLVACEPRRSGVALAGSRALALLACGPETRHDAVASVRAGFQGAELSQAWPAAGWDLRETPSGLFSHLFIARRREDL